jgi:hypothetical protein
VKVDMQSFFRNDVFAFSGVSKSTSVLQKKERKRKGRKKEK